MTDQHGVFDDDPRVNKNASLIKEIHFDDEKFRASCMEFKLGFKVVDNNQIVIFEKEINYLTIKHKNLIVNYNTDLINSRWQNIS